LALPLAAASLPLAGAWRNESRLLDEAASWTDEEIAAKLYMFD